MSAKNGAWKKNVKPRYTYEISEVPCVGGRSPSPRFSHSAIMVASKYLLIYGGRNDNLYKKLNGNVALNDLHLFDL
jgi:hypothetical protein